jgi:hypothetical protein
VVLRKQIHDDAIAGAAEGYGKHSLQ